MFKLNEVRTLTIREKISKVEDFSYKKDILRKYIREIGESNLSFYALFHEVFLDQEGKIIRELNYRTNQLFVQNNFHLSVTYKRANHIVDRFELQVDEMKTQRVTYTYRVYLKIV